jgi:ABC-type uncharacterized transport system permease subunit
MKTSNKLIIGLLSAILIMATVFIIILRNIIKSNIDVEKVNTECINKE